MTFVAALVLEKVDEEIENIADISTIPGQQKSIPLHLDQIIDYFDLASRLMETISQCFGSVLLIITAIDFSSAIFYFFQIFTSIRFSNESSRSDDENSVHISIRDIFKAYDPLNDKIIIELVVIYFVEFCHVILRFTAILIASHRGTSKVS